MAFDPDPEQHLPPARHVLRDLGWAVSKVGDELHGSATVVPEMHVPGTAHLRTSILATWADTITGLLAAETLRPRVPVTLELDVHLYAPAPGAGRIEGVCGVVKAGRSVFVADVEFTDEDGCPVGFAAASFMAAPDESITMHFETSVGLVIPEGTRLRVPFAERAGCERRAPGVAVLWNSDESRNASNTVNGGLIALAAEEALVSLAPGSTLSTLDLRYLQPVRVGPVVAEARSFRGLGRVEVRDAGNGDRVCVVGTGRTFLAPPA
jgi:acyl-coenzyme A thioesterase PaaI-like protein